MKNGQRSRPAGATLIALALGWLAISGFGNAVVWQSLSEPMLVQLPAEFAAFVVALQSPLFAAIAVIYGITAVVAAVAVWRMRAWKHIAFLAWVLVAMAFGLWLAWAMPAELVGGKAGGLAIVLVAAVLLGWAYLYVRRLPSELR